MNSHIGQVIEHAVRRNGYSISDLARNLCINRRSIYNYFQSPRLKPDVVLQIGKVLRHDFSKDFPGMFTDAEVKHMRVPTKKYYPTDHLEIEANFYKDKYLSLLEKYNELLEMGKIAEHVEA